MSAKQKLAAFAFFPSRRILSFRAICIPKGASRALSPLSSLLRASIVYMTKWNLRLNRLSTTKAMMERRSQFEGSSQAINNPVKGSGRPWEGAVIAGLEKGVPTRSIIQNYLLLERSRGVERGGEGEKMQGIREKRGKQSTKDSFGAWLRTNGLSRSLPRSLKLVA